MKHTYLTFLAALGMSVSTMADNWMSRLPDDLYVAQVSIPGAHDAATGEGFPTSTGETFSRTQDIGLKDQWALGIRAFDLRPATRDGYLHINHGITETNMRFDDALYLLRDSLKANPSEFAIIHLLHATDGDKVEGTYEQLLLELLQSDELKDYLVDFRRDLTVADMRGKILIMSRDKYADKPIGGLMTNWCGWIDWNVQTQGKCHGAGNTVYSTSPLYMQDLAATYKEEDMKAKLEGLNKMLDYSTTHTVSNKGQIVWIYNFASAYSEVFFGSISTSNGYRNNATRTHAAIIDYLNTHKAGPTGIVLMDYVGVDNSKDYATRGKEVVEMLIENNFKYLERINEDVYQKLTQKLNEAYDKLENTQTLINKNCADVAADFEDDLEEVKTSLDQMKAEVESLYEKQQLKESYKMETTTQIEQLNKIYQKAYLAQIQFEQASAIHTTTVDQTPGDYQIYSITGERLSAPRRGAVNIFRYDNGTVKKVKY